MTPVDLDAIFLRQGFGCRRHTVGMLASLSSLSGEDTMALLRLVDSARAVTTPSIGLVLEHLGDLLTWLTQDELESTISDGVGQLVLSLPNPRGLG